ncbi:MAG: hypothetical protein WDN28_23850 [Chthoniobacter sp.]
MPDFLHGGLAVVAPHVEEFVDDRIDEALGVFAVRAGAGDRKDIGAGAPTKK